MLLRRDSYPEANQCTKILTISTHLESGNGKPFGHRAPVYASPADLQKIVQEEVYSIERPSEEECGNMLVMGRIIYSCRLVC